MAENKKSVLLYCDIIHTVEVLSDDEAGRLFKHYLRYINDQNPNPPDKITQIVFEPIKQNLKRDLNKWRSKSERNSTIAKDGWKKRKESGGDATALPQETPIPHEPIKQVAVGVEILFKELPNTSHIETIAMRTGMTKENVVSLIPEFKKAAELTYPTPDKFYSHFKNWINKRITENKATAPKKRNQI